MLAGLEINQEYSTLVIAQDDNWEVVYQEKNSSFPEISFSAPLIKHIKQQGITNLSVNTLSDWGLNQRYNIIQQLQNQVSKINLVPTPLAALLAYQQQLPSPSLQGDILWIREFNNRWEYAFISVFPANKEIILECYAQGKQSDLLRDANRLGFYQQGKFTFKQILWTDFLLSANQTYYHKFFGNLPIKSTNSNDIMRGLSGWIAKRQNYFGQIKMIYPFNFYIEKLNPFTNQKEWHKLPFDTQNLALNINGTYDIFTFAAHNENILLDEHNQANIVIGESRSNKKVISSATDWHDGQTLLEYSCSPHLFNAPQKLNLNFQTNQLQLQKLNTDNSFTPALNVKRFWSDLNGRHKKQDSLLSSLQNMSPLLQQNIQLDAKGSPLTPNNPQLVKKNLLNKLEILAFLSNPPDI